MLGHRQTKHMMTPTLTTTLSLIVHACAVCAIPKGLDFIGFSWWQVNGLNFSFTLWPVVAQRFIAHFNSDSFDRLAYMFSVFMESYLIIEMLQCECQKWMNRRCLRCVKIISVFPTEEHLRLPPTPPSSHGSDSDGSQSPHSLPPLSPGQLQSPHSLPPSSPARLQARSSTAISSSPLLTAPHVSHTQCSMWHGILIIYNPNAHFCTHTL